MTPHVLSAKTYLLVLLGLLLLTALTLGVSLLPLSGRWHTLLGLSIGMVKATLVVLFFMHVIFTPRLTWVVLAVTIFWLVGVLFVLSLTDYLTRGLLPFLPGH